jgi:hypothetical protein
MATLVRQACATMTECTLYMTRTSYSVQRVVRKRFARVDLSECQSRSSAGRTRDPYLSITSQARKSLSHLTTPGHTYIPALAATLIPSPFTMSIAILSADRDRAKADLEVSPAWVAWKAAVTADRDAHRASETDLTPLLPLIDPTPEDVLRLTDGFEEWDAEDPIFREYKRVQQQQTEKQRINDLKQRVEESVEWRTLIRINRELKAQLAEEIKQLRQPLLVISKVNDAVVDKSPVTPPENVTAANGEASEAAAPQPHSQPKPAEHPSEKPSEKLLASPTNGRKDHSPAESPPADLPPAASRSTSTISSPTRFPSPFKRDESSKLMIPAWCFGVVQDLYQPVPEHGLGLVDAELYQGMCGSVRTQVQRIWSHKASSYSLLAGVLRALEFQVDTAYEPPSPTRVDELRDSILKTVSTWNDEELSACVPGYDAKKMSQEQFFMSAEGQVTWLYLYTALHPGTAPRIYVVVGNRTAQSQLSLLIVDSGKQAKLNTKCVVLFQNASNEPLPHVEVIGWKRGSRGPSPLKTVFDFSETIIQSLESWYLQHDTTPRSSRKRPREETKPIDLSGAEE